MTLSKRYYNIGQEALEEMREQINKDIEVRWWGDQNTYNGMTYREKREFLRIEGDRRDGNSAAAMILIRYPTKFIILSPRIRTSSNLSIFLHELGHIKYEDIGVESLYYKELIIMDATWADKYTPYIVQAEYRASQFAIDTMKKKGVLTKCAVKLLNDALASYDEGRGIVPKLKA